jgi:hypothetical protein
MKYQFAPLFIPACKTRMGPFDADIQSQVEMPIELVAFLFNDQRRCFLRTFDQAFHAVALEATGG